MCGVTSSQLSCVLFFLSIFCGDLPPQQEKQRAEARRNLLPPQQLADARQIEGVPLDATVRVLCPLVDLHDLCRGEFGEHCEQCDHLVVWAVSADTEAGRLLERLARNAGLDLDALQRISFQIDGLADLDRRNLASRTMKATGMQMHLRRPADTQHLAISGDHQRGVGERPRLEQTPELSFAEAGFVRRLIRRPASLEAFLGAEHGKVTVIEPPARDVGEDLTTLADVEHVYNGSTLELCIDAGLNPLVDKELSRREQRARFRRIVSNCGNNPADMQNSVLRHLLRGNRTHGTPQMCLLSQAQDFWFFDSRFFSLTI